MPQDMTARTSQLGDEGRDLPQVDISTDMLQSTETHSWISTMLHASPEDEDDESIKQSVGLNLNDNHALTPERSNDSAIVTHWGTRSSSISPRPLSARPPPRRHASYGDNLTVEDFGGTGSGTRPGADRSLSSLASRSIISSGEESFIDPLMAHPAPWPKQQPTRVIHPSETVFQTEPATAPASSLRSVAAAYDVLGRKLPQGPPTAGPIDIVIEARSRKTSAFSSTKSVFKSSKGSVLSKTRSADDLTAFTSVDLGERSHSTPYLHDSPDMFASQHSPSISSSTSSSLHEADGESSKYSQDPKQMHSSHGTNITPTSSQFPSVDSRRDRHHAPPLSNPPQTSLPSLPEFTYAFKQSDLTLTSPSFSRSRSCEPYPPILPPHSPVVSTSLSKTQTESCLTSSTVAFGKQEAVIERLGHRAFALEQKLARQSSADSPTSTTGLVRQVDGYPSCTAEDHSFEPITPHSRSTSESSRWWRPRLTMAKNRSMSSIQFRRSWSVQAEGWSILNEEQGSLSKDELKQRQEKNRALEARRKTQDWLATTTVDKTRSQSFWRDPRSMKPSYWKARIRNMSKRQCIVISGKAERQMDGTCVCTCSSRWAGTSCHLNATCTIDESGLPTAQAFLDILDRSNSLFEPQIDVYRVPVVLSKYFGRGMLPNSTSCQRQLDLVTLSNLNTTRFPYRIAWTEAAIVWANFYAESLTGIRSFASELDFNQIGDEPSIETLPRYQLLVSGYIFDFSKLTRLPPDVFWSLRTNPNFEQEQKVNNETIKLLNKVTTFAVAGSNGRQKALEHFWVEQGYELRQLEVFRRVVADSSIVVPASGAGLSLSKDSNKSIVEPLACSTSLSNAQIAAINKLEHDVLELPLLTDTVSSCASRPVYAQLDILNLGTSAFTDQAVILDPVVKPRCTFLYNPKLFNTIMTDDETLVKIEETDKTNTLTIQNIGVAGYIDHVLLQLLQSLQSNDTRMMHRMIRYIVAEPASSSSSTTNRSRWRGPTVSIQVQVWGSL
ncbi:hypothetical protein OIO90_001042 [Microbotryomycetes sp. JL221]|nr:hypothetical protein OIO90_001042 [Microbotryomycetes sp. JL221]